MKRVLGLAVLLLCASAVHGTRAAAQCGFASCAMVRDLETGQFLGWGCVEGPDQRTRCTATTRGCTISTCEFSAVILDTKGAVLASANLCGGRVREVRGVALVPAAPAAPFAAVSEDGPATYPPGSKLALARGGEPAAVR